MGPPQSINEKGLYRMEGGRERGEGCIEGTLGFPLLSTLAFCGGGGGERQGTGGDRDGVGREYYFLWLGA